MIIFGIGALISIISLINHIALTKEKVSLDEICDNCVENWTPDYDFKYFCNKTEPIYRDIYTDEFECKPALEMTLSSEDWESDSIKISNLCRVNCTKINISDCGKYHCKDIELSKCEVSQWSFKVEKKFVRNKCVQAIPYKTGDEK